MIWYKKNHFENGADYNNNMRSGFLDLILMPVQFNSIGPPGSRSRLVLKRDVIECFHSLGQYICKFISTTESVCIRKEFNSLRIGLGHQHGRRCIVLGHQYGCRDVTWKHSIACSRPSDCKDGALIYKQEKNSGLPLCLLIFFSRSSVSRRTRISERQKQILGLSEAETDQYCRFMSVLFAMNRQKFDELDQRYSNMHACNLVTDSLEQATWCYNWTPYPAHPSRFRRTSPAERVES